VKKERLETNLQSKSQASLHATKTRRDPYNEEDAFPCSPFLLHIQCLFITLKMSFPPPYPLEPLIT
jgi:hypothetical protein